jgi:RimJ/RimL family protein N-acetyltransferase
LFTDWHNDPEFYGEFLWFPQRSRGEREKWYESLPSDSKLFIIEKKMAKPGKIAHFLIGNLFEIGFILVPSERGKGYCSEAAQIMVDYVRGKATQKQEPPPLFRNSR